MNTQQCFFISPVICRLILGSYNPSNIGDKSDAINECPQCYTVFFSAPVMCFSGVGTSANMATDPAHGVACGLLVSVP